MSPACVVSSSGSRIIESSRSCTPKGHGSGSYSKFDTGFDCAKAMLDHSNSSNPDTILFIVSLFLVLQNYTFLRSYGLASLKNFQKYIVFC
jgi:hypothetical protein